MFALELPAVEPNFLVQSTSLRGSAAMDAAILFASGLHIFERDVRLLSVSVRKFELGGAT
jgi:hypothetical protein